jgi:superfamily II DNA/RNA helicase
MDFPNVEHVVLFDFPRDGVEYVRRVGRATRGTRAPGRVTSPPRTTTLQKCALSDVQ